MNTAIVVYSLTGKTRRLADRMAAVLGAEVCEIRAPDIRPGRLAIVTLGFRTLVRSRVRVALNRPLPAGIDAVVLAAPVWVGRVAFPMRDWLASGPALPPRRAVAMTGGDPRGPGAALAAFARLTGAPAACTLYVPEGALDDPALDARIATLLPDGP